MPPGSELRIRAYGLSQRGDGIPTESRLKHARERITNPCQRCARFRHRPNSVNDFLKFRRQRHLKDFLAHFRVVGQRPVSKAKTWDRPPIAQGLNDPASIYRPE